MKYLHTCARKERTQKRRKKERERSAKGTRRERERSTVGTDTEGGGVEEEGAAVEVSLVGLLELPWKEVGANPARFRNVIDRGQ